MGNPPFFSVIVPVHNKAVHIQRSMSSVLGQKFEDFELLVIEDASTDNSLEEIERFQDQRIRLYHRKTPGPGGYAARNLGINKARAKWVTFLDADDEWLDNHLEVVYKHLSGAGAADATATGFYFSRGAERSQDNYTRSHKGKVACFELESYLRARVRGYELISTNTIVVTKELMLKAGGFPEGKCLRGGDEDTWLRLFLAGMNMLRISVPTGVYHLDASGMVTGKSANAEDAHPVLETARLGAQSIQCRKTRRLLARFANRKTISWMRVAYEAGMDIRPHVRRLMLEGMDLYCACSLTAMLVLPKPVFRFLTSHIRGKP